MHEKVDGKTKLLKVNAKIISYPADIVLALCGDGLKDHFLAANAEENFFNLVQEFLRNASISVLFSQGRTNCSKMFNIFLLYHI